MEFENLDQLEAHVQLTINKVLQSDVSEAVKDVMQEKIDSEVLSKYNPKKYQRRSHGGLGSRENIKSILIDDGVLDTTNDAPFNPLYNSSFGGGVAGSLTEAVVKGIGYDYHNGGAYEEPRDFIGATVDALEETSLHVKSLKNGLLKNGIKAE